MELLRTLPAIAALGLFGSLLAWFAIREAPPPHPAVRWVALGALALLAALLVGLLATVFGFVLFAPQ